MNEVAALFRVLRRVRVVMHIYYDRPWVAGASGIQQGLLLVSFIDITSDFAFAIAAVRVAKHTYSTTKFAKIEINGDVYAH